MFFDWSFLNELPLHAVALFGLQVAISLFLVGLMIYSLCSGGGAEGDEQ